MVYFIGLYRLKCLEILFACSQIRSQILYKACFFYFRFCPYYQYHHYSLRKLMICRLSTDKCRFVQIQPRKSLHFQRVKFCECSFISFFAAVIPSLFGILVYHVLTIIVAKTSLLEQIFFKKFMLILVEVFSSVIFYFKASALNWNHVFHNAQNVWKWRPLGYCENRIF